MKIGLFGFTFSHENMGCQALTCSFLEMLRKNTHGESIEIVNFRSETIEGEIPNLFPEMLFSQYTINLKDLRFPFLSEIKKCDIIFDEYYGDGFSDIYFTKSVYRNTIIKCMVASTGVPFIMTPQTYGPFKHKTLERLAAIALRKSTKVYARDKISADYAEKISGRPVTAVTDLAFVLPFTEKHKTKNKNRLGLNISGLLWQGGFTKKNQFNLKVDYKEYCKQLVNYALNVGYEVHIIPHVTAPADTNRIAPDSDTPACKELASIFPSVYLAPSFKNPYEAKNYISNLNIFIGARMHATIAAFSSGVVTIPFSYSRKFQGLYDNISYPYYIDGRGMDTKAAVSKTVSFIESPKKLEYSMMNAMTQVHLNISNFEQELSEVLKKL